MPGVETVGLLGTGYMGKGMGERLLRAGYCLRVTAHRRRGNVDALIALGAEETDSAEVLAEGADTVLLCLPTAETVDHMVARLIPGMRQGALLLDCSTTAPDISRNIAAGCEAAGIHYAEAPLTGGAAQAAEGVCGALLAGSEVAAARARPVLECFCKSIEYFGGPGKGQAAKLLNNYMVIGIIALVTETFGKARMAGVDWRKLFEVAQAGSGDNGVMHRFFPKGFDGDFSGYLFAVGAARKDMAYFADWSREVGGPSELATTVLKLFETHETAGRGELRVSELLAPENNGDPP